ncbi:hypothetical protein SADUNF_Sadunf01G0019100 [Salix dunnii]|uniref:Uncharacterized protein n=1 Tax=Salix dunnii TaxID=1413687 RepID=A0A835N9D0_9ROSI|nr:hypothetical protein SADUNF_Sadunf01G0019100 [Salix dunnii]
MKVFANMESLKIKLCLFPSVKLMERVGSLSCHDEGMFSYEWNRFYLGKIENSLMLSFSVVILCHQPKMLSRAVILIAGILGHSLEGGIIEALPTIFNFY